MLPILDLPIFLYKTHYFNNVTMFSKQEYTLCDCIEARKQRIVVHWTKERTYVCLHCTLGIASVADNVDYNKCDTQQFSDNFE